MKKSIILPAAVLAILSMASCKQKNTDSVIATMAQDTINITVEQVVALDVDQVVSFAATVQAEVSNSIAPQAPVRIRKINVEVGDRVAKGQTLVVLDNNNLEQLKLQLENREVEFKRIDELFKIGGVSKSQWEQQKVQLEVMRQSFQNIEENTRLVSPISGVVTARNYDNGDLYAGQPVLVVEQITPVKMLIDVNETYYSQIKVGMPVDNITLEAYPGEAFSGKVSIVYPTVNTTTRTFQVEISIPNKDQRVRPGMYARANINLGQAHHATVSDNAVQKMIGSGERYVYVLNADGKTVSHRTIELGRRMEGANATRYEIVSGLAEGEIVAVSGQSKLADGRAVNVIHKSVERN